MNDTPIILRPEFIPSLERYRKQIRYDLLDDAQVEADELFARVSKELNPKILLCHFTVYNYSQIDGVPSVVIGGEQFVGKALQVLNGVHQVIAYVLTCGSELESLDVSTSDFLAPFWLEAMKLQSFAKAHHELINYVRNLWQVKKPLSLNPGSGNVDIWPIEQIQGLFRILGTGESIGVRLTESSLMIPSKSMAGFIFTTE